MLPSKAERILSRYRPIAPKPLPFPPPPPPSPSDPSSTCASADSFASYAISKKSRKRRAGAGADDASSSAKPPKSVASSPGGGAASSLTQGGAASNGSVPLRDLRSTATQLSQGSFPHGVDDAAEMSMSMSMSNGTTQDARDMASELRFATQDARDRFAAYGGSIVAPLYVADAGNMVQPQGLYMLPEGTPQQLQHQFALLHQPMGTPDCNPNHVISMDRDTGFMERAAAASSSVMPERPASIPVCDVGCAKGVGYVGGGFTEMIRGITRLPTAADVQSLMQARASSAIPCGQGAVSGTGSPSPLRLSPTSGKEMAQRKFDSSFLPAAISHDWTLRSQACTDAEQMCDNDTDLVTLPLLPNVPSRLCSSSAGQHSVGSPSNQVPSPSCNMDILQRNQASSRDDDASTSFSSKSTVATICPLFSTGAKKVVGGLTVAGMNSPLMQVSARPVVADGAAIDENYLEHVYGVSTDPVLLLDDKNQVLWYNKPYDKALKSASERYSGKAASTGPYIDPLGHPTPLGTFIFPYCGKHVRATLWGFLRKLVIQENKALSEHAALGPSSQLQLRMGGMPPQRLSPAGTEPVSSIHSATCSRSSLVTTMTLESVTEAHMDVPSVAESVEVVESRLGAGNVPSFITDCMNRVRWANAALWQMLGKMGPDGSGSHFLPSNKAVSGSVRLGTAEPPLPFVICCTEKVPCSAWAFSCLINIEWFKGGRRRSITVPCDVIRVIGNIAGGETQWAWQFDMAGSLCLNTLA